MTMYVDRARFVAVEDGFNIKRPPIEPQAFVAERTKAFETETPSGFIPLDLSDTLGTDYEATTPFILTRYMRIRAGDTIDYTFLSSGEIWAVLCGAGILKRAAETIHWARGDMLVLPGGIATEWFAVEDSVLWVSTDEPTLAFACAHPRRDQRAPIEVTHYKAARIAWELETLYNRSIEPDTPGRAIFMSTERMEKLGTCLPSMTLTLNAVRPGEAQRPHRHNAAAIVLALREAGCSSTIGGQRFPWERHVTILTPAGVAHDHFNSLEIEDEEVTEDDIALALIVQDGGLYYYARTMGFAFVE